jgi:hypothetical protein
MSMPETDGATWWHKLAADLSFFASCWLVLSYALPSLIFVIKPLAQVPQGSHLHSTVSVVLLANIRPGCQDL